MSSADWWSRKMSHKESVPDKPLPPTPVSFPRAQPQQPQQPYSPPQHLPSSPTPARGCPECGSGNWMRPSASVAARCFDCGHVEGRDFDLSASGSISRNAPSKATKQVASGGFNPQQIVGRIE